MRAHEFLNEGLLDRFTNKDDSSNQQITIRNIDDLIKQYTRGKKTVGALDRIGLELDKLHKVSPEAAERLFAKLKRMNVESVNESMYADIVNGVFTENWTNK